MCFHHNPEITSLWGCKVTMIVIIGLFYTACFQWCPQTVCPKRCKTDNICVTLFHCMFSYVTRRCLFAMFSFVWLFKCFPNWLLQRLHSLQLFEVSVTLQHIWSAQLSLINFHFSTLMGVGMVIFCFNFRIIFLLDFQHKKCSKWYFRIYDEKL